MIFTASKGRGARAPGGRPLAAQGLAAVGVRRAFTLLELVLVLTLMVLVVAMSAPAFQNWSRSHRLRQGVDNVWTLLVKGRGRAMKDGRPYRFACMIGLNRYRLAPDGLQFWPDQPGAGTVPQVSGPGYGPVLVMEAALPTGVQFLPGSTALDKILFMPDGTAKIFAADGTERPETQVLIGDGRGQVRVLNLRGVSGVVTVLNLRTPLR